MTKIKTIKSSEYQEQCAIFDWCEANKHKYPDLNSLFATLNGVKMSIGLAKKCKRAGMRKGILDLYLLKPRGGFHGLVIELKIGTNKPTKEQYERMEELKQDGYMATWCIGAEAAIDIIKTYLILSKYKG